MSLRVFSYHNQPVDKNDFKNVIFSHLLHILAFALISLCAKMESLRCFYSTSTFNLRLLTICCSFKSSMFWKRKTLCICWGLFWFIHIWDCFVYLAQQQCVCGNEHMCVSLIMLFGNSGSLRLRRIRLWYWYFDDGFQNTIHLDKIFVAW